MRLKLDLPNEDFRALADAIDKTRPTSKVVAVDKTALAKLIADHGRLISEFRGEIGGNL
jgi:hypothetical protein